VMLGDLGFGEDSGGILGFALPVLVLVFIGGSLIIALMTANQMVVASSWGIVQIREYLNQAQVFYLGWEEVKKVSVPRRGGLRLHRGLRSMDLPDDLGEMAPDGTLRPDERPHPLLTLVLRHCRGARIHEKLVESLRVQDPSLFQQLAAPQRKQGSYYLNPGVEPRKDKP